MAQYDVTIYTSLDFDTGTLYAPSSCEQIDATHYITFYKEQEAGMRTQVVTINTTTWAVTTSSSRLDYDGNGGDNSCAKIDTNHFIDFWLAGTTYDQQAQVFTVNTTTWAVTTANNPLEYTTDAGYSNACIKMDLNHFVNFHQQTASDGFVQSFTVNTTTWAVSTNMASALEFDTQNCYGNAPFLVDTNHIILFWAGGATPSRYTQVFTVSTSTWAVTTANSSLNYDTTGNMYGNGNQSCYQIDSTHFINFWGESANVGGFTQVFTVSTSTWAVTTAGAKFEFSPNRAQGSTWVCKPIDANHFILWWPTNDYANDYVAQVFTVNTSTWEVTTTKAVTTVDANRANYLSGYRVDTNHYLIFSDSQGVPGGGAEGDAYAQMFAVEIPAVGPANLKSYNTNLKANIKTINGNLIANCKSLNTNI